MYPVQRRHLAYPWFCVRHDHSAGTSCSDLLMHTSRETPSDSCIVLLQKSPNFIFVAFSYLFGPRGVAIYNILLERWLTELDRIGHNTSTIAVLTRSDLSAYIISINLSSRAFHIILKWGYCNLFIKTF
eukprot:Rmarinus@m.16371